MVCAQAKADLNAEVLLTKEKPIHIAGGDMELVFQLIAMKADIDAQEKNGISRFHMAVQAADDPLCRRLLDLGADINRRQGNVDMSPLQIVCAKGYVELLRTFIKADKIDRKTLGWEGKDAMSMFVCECDGTGGKLIVNPKWSGPPEDDIKEQYELFKLKNKKHKKGQVIPDPTPNQREVLKVLKKHVAPCVIL